LHQNALFLDRLATDLGEILANQTLLGCFSTNKDEVYFIFSESCIKGTFFRGVLYLEFPKSEHLPQKNRKVQFRYLQNQKVNAVSKHPLNRSFAIQFKSYQLVFKCYGRNSNILLFQKGKCIDLFRENLKSDFDLTEVDFQVKPNRLSLLQGDTLANIASDYRFLSKDILAYLSNFDGSLLESLENLESLIADSDFVLYQKDNGQYGMQYSQIPITGTPLESNLSSTQILNTYARWELQKNRFDTQLQTILTGLNRNLKKIQKKVQKLEKELNRLQTKVPYFQIADVIMANLHTIDRGLTNVSLFNFYTNENIDIALKKDLSPQKNAEKYYKKGKNSSKELRQVEDHLATNKDDISELQEGIDELGQAVKLSDLKKWQKIHDVKKSSSIDPFRMFEFKDYTIWVGKNSNNNDQLLKRAHKDDIWMHARNVAGSHVLIRNHKTEGIPKSVIEYAASLAAYYSKGRNESLSEVIFTPRKYVRKFKGALAGQVKVEKEDVILVEPFRR
jgi:predicted ribosome quality control (RQC) complex YloA/Tae2 family protein